MKAVRKLKKGACGVSYVEIEEPAAGPDEVKIKVEYCGICGSDLHILEGFEGGGVNVPIPLTIGHEFSGIVAETGERVKDFQVGDRVTSAGSKYYCGKCKACLSGRYSECEGKRGIGYQTDGAMTEYICMDQGMVFKLPEHVSLEAGALAEPASVSAHAVFDLTTLLPEDMVVVIGAGTIGLFAVQLAKSRGARVALVGRSSSAERLELGRQLGADFVFLNDRTDVRKEIMELTDHRGAEVVYDCAGSDAAIDEGILLTRKGGTLVELGVTNPSGSNIKNFLYAVMNEIRIQGSFSSTLDNWPKVLELMESKKINAEAMISHRFSYQDCEEAFSVKANVKVLLHP